MKGIISRLDKERCGEIVRFFVVGASAVAIQYGVYLLLIGRLSPTISNTIAYLVSFIFNYVASVRYTFRVRSSVRRGTGFAFSHLINYLLQTGLLNVFLWLGVSKSLAMLPVFAVCVPVNFLLVRHFLKNDER